MNIQEATKQSLATGRRITRKGWTFQVEILPTDTVDHCICSHYEDKQKAPRRGWQPKAQDLVADDWVFAD